MFHIWEDVGGVGSPLWSLVYSFHLYMFPHRSAPFLILFPWVFLILSSHCCFVSSSSSEDDATICRTQALLHPHPSPFWTLLHLLQDSQKIFRQALTNDPHVFHLCIAHHVRFPGIKASPCNKALPRAVQPLLPSPLHRLLLVVKFDVIEIYILTVSHQTWHGINLLPASNLDSLVVNCGINSKLLLPWQPRS